MSAMIGTILTVLAGAVASLVLLVRLKNEQAAHRATEALLEAALQERDAAKKGVASLEAAVASRDRMLDEALETCRADTSPDALRLRLQRLLDPAGLAPAGPGAAAAGQRRLPLG